MHSIAEGHDTTPALADCLCYLTIIPCIFMRSYQGGHAEKDVRSFFQINYQPAQVFDAIRPQLWVPGFSGMAVAMEIQRNVFW